MLLKVAKPIRPLLAGVVTIPCLNEQIFAVCSEGNLVIAVGGRGLVWRISKSILRAQFFGDLIVDLGDWLLLCYLKQPPSSFVGHLLKYLLSVDVTHATA